MSRCRIVEVGTWRRMQCVGRECSSQAGWDARSTPAAPFGATEDRPESVSALRDVAIGLGGPAGWRARRTRLGGTHLGGARTLGARLDLEDDTLAADEAVEVHRGIESAAMEEIFLRILGGDEAKAAIGDDLLDGTGGHEDLQHFPNWES